jgi:ribonuclease HI
MTWHNGLIFDYQLKELRKLDRLACRAAVTINRTTPQAALNIILDITPIHLRIQELAIAAFARLEPVLGNCWKPIQDSKRVPHLWHLKTVLESRCLQLPPTDSCKEDVFDRHFCINLDSFDGLRKHRQHAEYTIYTDGSRTKDGTGSGFVLYHKKTQIDTRSYALHANATVFQAEVHAIKKACQFLNSSDAIHPRYIKILSDSQAAIKALASKTITSTLVLDTLYELELLASRSRRVTIAWVKAHIGTEGNEAADAAAKSGAEGKDCETDGIPLPKIYERNLIRNSTKAAWKAEWLQASEYKHSKHFYAGPDSNKAKLLLKHSKTTVSKLVKIITGHNFLSYFQYKVDNTVNPYCRLCDEAYETFHHFITTCPVLRSWRLNIFGDDHYNDKEWTPLQLYDFSQHETIDAWLSNPDYLIEQPIYELEHNYSSDGDVD